jgi:hypothetical protein
METPLGQAYNEEAFRYFLAVERKLSERSPRPFLLLRVDLPTGAGTHGDINPAVAAQLFSGLWRCLRETDVIGWLREGRVAGAILTPVADPSAASVARLIHDKVRGTLCASLPSDTAARLRVRVSRLRPRRTDRG